MIKVSVVQRYSVLVLVLVLAMTPSLAQAYIDPGSGAYMLQAMFALVGAALFYVRHPIRSARAFARWFAKRWSKGGELSTEHAALDAENRNVSLDLNKANSNSDEAH